MTPNMLNLQWNAVVLYPAGHYASRIRYAASVKYPAGFRAATALDVKAGAKVVRMETLSLADGRPLSRATTRLSYRAFPDFVTRFAEHPSFTRAFSSYGIADYSRASTRISARHADVEETKLLALTPGAILLVSEGVDVDSAGNPISYALSRFPAERMELVV